MTLGSGIAIAAMWGAVAVVGCFDAGFAAAVAIAAMGATVIVVDASNG